MKAVKERYPSAYVIKLADRFRRGPVDILIQAGIRPIAVERIKGFTLYVEAKVDGEPLRPIQIAEHEKITRAWGTVLVARDVECVLSLLGNLGAVP